MWKFLDLMTVFHNYSEDHTSDCEATLFIRISLYMYMFSLYYISLTMLLMLGHVYVVSEYA